MAIVLHRASLSLLVVWIAMALGCAEAGPRLDGTISLGHSNEGVLLNGVSLPDEGEGYVRARPGESTRFGTPKLVTALERAAKDVADTFEGTSPLRIGDLSSPFGGRHQRHRSHRSGRDADIIYYVTDAEGRSSRGRGWLAFDRFGVARETNAGGGAPGSGDVFFFDDARNWHLVRSLVLDEEAEVQWIFCSYGVKSRLLRYAAEHETDSEALFRASWVLQQPSRGSPHADHFHIRVACGGEQRALGCYDRGPIWPWIRGGAEKSPDAAPEPMNDEALVHALLDEPAAPSDTDERLAQRATPSSTTAR